MKDHYRTVIDGKSPETALELVPIEDRAQAVRHVRLIGRQQSDVRRPVTCPASLGVAGAHEEPVRPGVKARRVAELRQVPPDGQQRLLRRILGKIGVAQNSLRHRVESVARGDGKAREGLLVTVLGPSDQIGIHVSSAESDPVDPGRSYGMGARAAPATQCSRSAGQGAILRGDHVRLEQKRDPPPDRASGIRPLLGRVAQTNPLRGSD
jgi:hypothetical protein